MRSHSSRLKKKNKREDNKSKRNNVEIICSRFLVLCAMLPAQPLEHIHYFDSQNSSKFLSMRSKRIQIHQCFGCGSFFCHSPAHRMPILWLLFLRSHTLNVARARSLLRHHHHLSPPVSFCNRRWTTLPRLHFSSVSAFSASASTHYNSH